MNLPELAVRRPVMTSMVFVAVIVLGLVAMLRLSIDLLPNIEFPAISISTVYEGVGPEEMETLITRPVEEAVSTIQGIDRIESSSAEGRSAVQLRFIWGTSLDGAMSDVRAAVERIRAILPEEAEAPAIFKFNISSFPIVFLMLSGNMEPWRLRLLADETLKYRLERVEGVAAVDVRGGVRREIHVDLSAQKLSSYGLTAAHVAEALRRDNINLPAGDVRDKGKEVIVRTVGEFKNVGQIADTVVDLRDGKPLLVGDLGTVRDSFEEPTNTVYIDGKPGIRMAVSKLPDANTVEVSDRVRKEVEQINREMPMIKLGVRFDSAEYIKDSINSIKESLLIGALLAFGVLLVFLRSVRATFIVGVAIPIAVIGTFALMYIWGITLNMVSFGGLAIGVGMLVDNSIVILENIQRHREWGEPPIQAAVKGSGEVAMAITASTLTTVCVFLPVIFIEGFAGIFFGQLALVVTFALLCSLAVALTLVPVLSSLGKGERRKEPRIAAVLGRALDRMNNGYASLVRWAIGRRKTVYAFAAALIAGAVAMAPLVGRELMPEADQGEISVEGELPVGTPLETTQAVFKKIQKKIMELVPEREVVMGVAGQGGFHASSGSNSINMRIALRDAQPGDRPTEKVAAALRPYLASIPDFKPRVRLNEGFFVFRLLRGGGERISVEVRGFDMGKGMRTAKKVAAMVEKVPGVTDVDIDMKEGGREAVVMIDGSKAADKGLSVGKIGETVSTYVLGRAATYFRDRGDEFTILVRLQEKDRYSEGQLVGLPLITPAGKRISLGDVAKIVGGYAPMTIRRLNQERIITVSAGFAGRDLGSVVKDINASLGNITVPEGFNVAMGGEYEEQQETFSQLLIGFLLSILLVYMVMASLFESFLHPFTILFSIPFGIVGVIGTLVLTGTTLNVYSFLGVIVLVGIVVNNAIVLVDYVNMLRRDQGFELVEAVVEGAQRRLRPILMTTLTTVMAMLPIAMGFAEGSDLQTPLARVVLGGLFVSMLITLVFIPCLYISFTRRRAAPSG